MGGINTLSWPSTTLLSGLEAMPIVKYDKNIVTLFVFNQIISQFGIQSDIVTDHGSHFHNEMLEEIASKLGFRHGHFSPYYP
jgi:hypothetical protein